MGTIGRGGNSFWVFFLLLTSLLCEHCCFHTQEELTIVFDNFVIIFGSFSPVCFHLYSENDFAHSKIIAKTKEIKGLKESVW